MTAPRQFTISSYCGNGGCVAVAPVANGNVALRDSKQADGPVLIFTPAEWDAFVAGVKDGEFDRGLLSSVMQP